MTFGDRRTRLKPISDRKRARTAQRREVVAEARARDRGRCRLDELVGVAVIDPEQPFAVVVGVVPDRCWGPLDAHEIIPRSVWRDGDLDVDNVAMLCRAHHDWVGDNPNAAELLGLHGRSWGR